MRALNSMSTQLARAHFLPAQLLAAILLSLAIPLMLLPTSPYRPCTPPHPPCPVQQIYIHTFSSPITPHATPFTLARPMPSILLPYQLRWMVLAFSRCPPKGLHTKSHQTALQPNAATQETHESHGRHTSHTRDHRATTTHTHTRAETRASRTSTPPHSPTPNLNPPPTP
jgi:hypothetical protein